MSSPSVLVFGASGRIGREVYHQLTEKKITVYAAVKDLDGAELKSLPKESVIKADLDNFDEVKNAATQSKAQSVFLYVTDGGAKSAIDAFKASGNIQRIVFLSSLSLSKKYNGGEDAISKQHGEVEANIKASGLKYTFLRPGAFSANSVMWKHAIAHGNEVEWSYPEAAPAPIADEDVAAVAVKALTSSELDNQHVDLVGPQAISQRDQLTTIGKVLGKQLTMKEISEDQFRQTHKDKIPPPIINAIISFWKALNNQPEDTSNSANIQKYGGRTPTTFEQFVQKHKNEYQDLSEHKVQ